MPAERAATPGAAAGLVWSAVGGQVQYVECICVGTGRAGNAGQLTLTGKRQWGALSRGGEPARREPGVAGVLCSSHASFSTPRSPTAPPAPPRPAGQLGDVLEESARIALSWVRAHAGGLGLPGGAACPSRQWDVHIHLPAGEGPGRGQFPQERNGLPCCGMPPLLLVLLLLLRLMLEPSSLPPPPPGAIPKDGPSAGITLAVALVSLFTGTCVRPDAAMTGTAAARVCGPAG